MQGIEMTQGVPFRFDPEVDLQGATPETLARALLRNKVLGTSVAKPVAGDQVAVEKASTDETGDGVTHLVDGV